MLPTFRHLVVGPTPLVFPQASSSPRTQDNKMGPVHSRHNVSTSPGTQCVHFTRVHFTRDTMCPLHQRHNVCTSPGTQCVHFTRDTMCALHLGHNVCTSPGTQCVHFTRDTMCPFHQEYNGSTSQVSKWQDRMVLSHTEPHGST